MERVIAYKSKSNSAISITNLIKKHADVKILYNFNTNKSDVILYRQCEQRVGTPLLTLKSE